MANLKSTPLTYEELSSVLSYDPDTGKMVWLKDVSKNIKAGTEAGCYKGVRLVRSTGEYARYMYIRYKNIETPAARVAWLLAYKEWPKGNVLFEDLNSANLKLENLKEGMFLTRGMSTEEKKNNKMPKEIQRHYGLRRHYGLTLSEYKAIYESQNGLCSICKRPETVKIGGNLKDLSVDHNHTTKKNRELLCTQCNYLVGHCREDANILREAIKYLERHSG